MLEFGGGALPDSPVAAHNIVVLQLVNHVFAPRFSNGVSKFQFNDRLCHGSDRDEQSGYAKDDEKGVKDTPHVVERMNFGIPNRGHGSERHIERIKGRVAGDPCEAHGADRQRRHDSGKQKERAAYQSAHRTSPNQV